MITEEPYTPDCCVRCGHKKGEDDGGCSAWGKSWKRHWYIKTDMQFLVNENMIMWAFRYALGRRTGAVNDVCDHLKTHWNKLKPFTQNQIKEEIRDAFRVDRAGDYCDIIQWQEILKLPTTTDTTRPEKTRSRGIQGGLRKG